jgi:hypothetical protein
MNQCRSELPFSKTFVRLLLPPKGRLAPSAPEDFEMADLDDLNRNIMLGNLGKLAQLQQQREQLELLEKHERQRRGVCPCPHCGGGVPQRDVAVCMHCQRALYWHKGFCGVSIEQARHFAQVATDKADRDRGFQQWQNKLLDDQKRQAIAWKESPEGKECQTKFRVGFILVFLGPIIFLVGLSFLGKEDYPFISLWRLAALFWTLSGVFALRKGLKDTWRAQSLAKQNFCGDSWWLF